MAKHSSAGSLGRESGFKIVDISLEMYGRTAVGVHVDQVLLIDSVAQICKNYRVTL